MTKQTLISTALVIIGLTAGGIAQAGQAWVSVPSTPTGEDSILITGGALPPNSTVTVLITYPNGTQTKQTEAVDADGRLSVYLTLGTPGGYAVKVLDAKGKTIGGGRFGYMK